MTGAVGQVANLPGQISNLPHDIDILRVNKQAWCCRLFPYGRKCGLLPRRQIVQPALDQRRLVGVAVDLGGGVETAIEPRGRALAVVRARARSPARRGCCNSASSDDRDAALGVQQLAIELGGKGDHLPQPGTPGRGLLAGLVDKRRHGLGQLRRCRASARKAARTACCETTTARDRPVPTPVEGSLRCIGQAAGPRPDRPPTPSTPATRRPSSIGSGRNRISWQRERIVGSCLAGLVPIRISTERGGGSSSVFSRALAPSAFR